MAGLRIKQLPISLEQSDHKLNARTGICMSQNLFWLEMARKHQLGLHASWFVLALRMLFIHAIRWQLQDEFDSMCHS